MRERDGRYERTEADAFAALDAAGSSSRTYRRSLDHVLHFAAYRPFSRSRFGRDCSGGDKASGIAHSLVRPAPATFSAMKNGGIIQSLGTPWGLFRLYWVLVHISMHLIGHSLHHGH